MQLTNPIALWGLTGLLIPIGIHLLSRKEGKIIRIGSIRHLEDTNTRQFKSIRLNELGLLVLRCMLITAIVFLLSGLHFSSLRQNENWLVVEKGLELDKQFASLIDSLRESGYELRLLAKGFPGINDSTEEQGKINYWQLTDALRERPLHDVVVLSYNYVKGFGGRQLSLPDNIQWITKPPVKVNFPLYAKQLSKDSILVRAGQSDETVTSFQTTKTFIPSGDNTYESIPIEPLDTVSISIVSDSAFLNDKMIVHTALKVLDENAPVVFDFADFTTTNFKPDIKPDWIIWLSDKPLPPTLRTNSICFSNNADDTNLFMLENFSNENSSWILTKRLNTKIAWEENLTVQLGQILLSANAYASRIQQFDRQILSEKTAWHETVNAVEGKRATMPTGFSTEILAVIILIFLVVERFVAYKRNQ